MSDDAAFLQAIAEEPDGDLPRLIFADWLEENDQPERAEFIRLQIQRHQLPVGDPQHHRPSAREAALLQKWQAEWLGVFPLVGDWEWGTFERGFVNSVQVHIWHSPRRPLLGAASEAQDGRHTAWLHAAGEVFARQPITELRLGRLSHSEADLMLNGSFLPRIRVLRLAPRTAADVLARLLSCPDLQGVQELHLERCGFSQEWWDILLAGNFSSLRRLSLADNRLGPDLARQLLRESRWPALQQLNLAHNRLNASIFDNVAGLFGLYSLQTLDLSRNAFHGETLEAIQHAEQAAATTELSLAECNLQSSELARLFAGPLWSNVQHLDLSINRLTGDAVAELGHAACWLKLKQLRLGHNSLRAQGMWQLGQHPPIPELVELNLANTELDGQALEYLAQWPGLANVAILVLNANPFGSSEFRHLCRSPYLNNLRVLALRETRIQPTGLGELLEAPWLAGLWHLDLSFRGLPGEPLEVDQFQPLLGPNLRALHLEGFHLTPKALERVLELPGEHPLCSLFFDGIATTDAATAESLLQALRGRLGEGLEMMPF